MSACAKFSVVSTRTFATPKLPEFRECGENYKRDRFCNDRDGSNIVERGQSGFHTRLIIDDRPDLAAFINSCPRSGSVGRRREAMDASRRTPCGAAVVA